ncbi:hypothetical protein MRB53_029276 [Persea americana]|uniref:Uncharacterized protein n=1 Tax=Persea americana TaxID=3435 RepID=A0ACC2KIC5_PERAE|nr:hypothetical protein MRB53_029276 [Persea americana]
MKEHWHEPHHLHLAVFILTLLPLSSTGQLISSESRALYRIRRLLEYPPALNGWTNWTNICYLPSSPSLTITCSQNRVTELTVIGIRGPPSLGWTESRQKAFAVSPQSLSSVFSIDSLFTTLSKLSSLEVLSLVSLGLWGPLPEKISRFSSLRVLNLSSNFIYGGIPSAVSFLNSLKSLDLDNNLFNGTVPDLGGLSGLKELDLGRNLLGPEFPSLGNTLTSLVLRNNMFRSNIPPQLQYFNQLQRLDLSFNDLQGPIPAWLFSLPTIQYLNLGGNKLSGALPMNVSCSDRLGFVDISSNLLIGRLPLCIRSNSSNRAVLYAWNCLSAGDSKYQHPYSLCHEEALAAIMPQVPIEKHGSKSKLGILLGIAGGILGGLLVLGFAIWVIHRKVVGSRKTKNGANLKSYLDKASIRASPRLVPNASYVPHALRLGPTGLPPYRIFTLEELEEATNNFHPSNLLGEGSMGQEYKGRIRDGSLAAVRCFKLERGQAIHSLTEHMEVISKLRHRHLVSIIGHCIITHQDSPSACNTIFLIFEYISNGTLRCHLSEEQKQEMLTWPQRLAIAIGVARGTQFLHSGIAPGIFGNDLNIENIVLDEHLTAKISGYSLPIASKIRNTKVGVEIPLHGGEIDDWGRTENGNAEDVYQLGVILLQLITGKPIASQNELEVLKHQLESSLMDAPQNLQGVTDPSILGTFAYESLRTATELSINCLSKHFRQRPSIEDVLWNLQYSVQVQEGWAASDNLSTRS